jgi:NADPH2:quinone reductase
MNAVATLPASTRVSRVGEGVAPSRTLRRMRAAVVSAPGKINIVKTEIPEPNPNQLLVHVEGCGVCASNIPPWEGKPWFEYPMAPGALGHEGWGRVEDAGSSVTDFKQGDRISFLSSNAYADYDVCDSSAAVKLPEIADQYPFPANRSVV